MTSNHLWRSQLINNSQLWAEFNLCSIDAQLPNGMTTETKKVYPGELATTYQVLTLAHEYRNAAIHLVALGRPREPLSRAPFRLAAIHAIELYLNAFLLQRGHPASEIRGLQHNLAERLKLAATYGLHLKVKTAQHINDLAENREYLVTRYGPEMTNSASKLNRLTATMEEVSSKISKSMTAEVARM